MRALIIYSSRTGVTEGFATCLAEVLNSAGHSVSLHRLQAVKRPTFLQAAWDALRRKEAVLTADPPSNLRQYDLVIVACPVWAGRTPPEMNTFLNHVPDSVGKRFGVFTTMGRSVAGVEPMRSMKNRLERAGAVIIFEDSIRHRVAVNEAECRARCTQIARELTRESVW